MRRTRTLAALVSLGIAAAIVATAPASAAPAKAENQNARAVQVQKNKTLNAIRIQNRAYGIIRAKVTVCSRPAYPAADALKTRARAELTRAAQLRLNALVGLRQSLPVANLNRRQASLLRATRGMQAINRLCIAARAATAAPAPAPTTVQIEVPGTPPGSTVTQTPVTVGDLLGLGTVLPDGLLPQTLSIVDGLVPGLLSATNGVLALDPNKLIGTLDGVVKGLLPACQLLDVGCLLNGVLATVNGLLGTVTNTLLSGNLNELLTVGNLGGNVLTLLPTGALADLLAALPTEALTGLLGTEIGVLNILN